MKRCWSNILVALTMLSCGTNNDRYNTWQNYGGSSEMIRYSSLQQIDTNNVRQLQVAWTYHTGDADTTRHSQIQCNPIIVNGIVYGTSPQLKLIALDAATGKERWVFNPRDTAKNKSLLDFILNNNRGVTYWSDGKNDERILYTVGSNVYAINVKTGLPIPTFGKEGAIDLHDGLGRDVSKLFITATSPGIVFKDLYILGSRVEEGAAAAPGHIRAFDIRTGRQRWIFHTIPQPGEAGYETWEDSIAYKHIGGTNSWAGFTLDEQRGILFAPTGSASPDFYGATRKGQNLYGNCLLALDAATGKRRWHFQFVHHDVWDWDLPTAPALVTVQKDGRNIDAVAQPTKHGMIYLFERETGRPVYPVQEQAVDTNTTLPGEKLWPTQPISTFSKPFVRQTFSADDLNPYLPDTSIAGYRGWLAVHCCCP